MESLDTIEIIKIFPFFWKEHSSIGDPTFLKKVPYILVVTVMVSLVLM
jgi:hypothetical protein